MFSYKNTEIMLPPKRIILLTLISCFFTSFMPQNRLIMQGCADGTEDIASSKEAYEYEVLLLTNQIRIKKGLQPLKIQSDLRRAARYHATDMSQDNYMDHHTYDRNSRGDLIQVCDIWTRMAGFYKHTLAAAENVAEGYPTPTSVVQAWMNSKGHRKNILNEDYRAIGIAYIKENGRHPYWAQSFGAMRERFHLLINLDAASTTQTEVELYMQGDWQKMRRSNDGKKWTSWQSFKNKSKWELDSQRENKSKRVFIEVEDRNGKLYATTDIILLER